MTAGGHLGWSAWTHFPNPNNGNMLTAPFGPMLRVRHGGRFVLFGMAGHVAARMTSLLPTPLGRGTRNNPAKRAYLEQHLAEIDGQVDGPGEGREAVGCDAALRNHALARIKGWKIRYRALELAFHLALSSWALARGLPARHSRLTSAQRRHLHSGLRSGAR
jgi:hypothetical protein